ncbi:MAG: sulfatase [Opitutaceae bacterium]
MRRLLAAALLITGAAPRVALAADAGRPPNILFIFSDDQRHDTLGSAGHPIVRTPTLDRLAADGVRFRNAFVTTSVCWVSRAVVLTGQWARSHIRRDSVPTVRPEALATMFPELLRSAGYRTAHFGKWHLIAPPGFSPAEHYDVYEAIGRNPYFKTLPDGTRRHETDLVSDRGVEFIRTQPRDRPFLLNLWFNASHAEDNDRRPGVGHHPWPPSADGLYEDIAIPSPRLGARTVVDEHPPFLLQSINRERFFWGYDTPEKFTANVRAYYRMITGIDHAVARVLAALEAAELADNTIVVYSSDNGYYLGDRGFQGKWSHYEESLRVPLIIRDPRAPRSARGRVVDAMALNVDLPATFLDWAGVPRPAAYEGRSLAPFTRGEKPSDWRNHFFCEHLDLAPTLTWEGIRGERFVYARYFDQQPAFEFLHDLAADPDQLRNLAADPAHAADLARVRALCDEEMGRRGGPLPPLDQRGVRKANAKRKAK